MKRNWVCLLLLFIGLCSGRLVGAERPVNIVFFLCDDLGYGDVGCYGQEKIHTPNVDRLATEGMKFTNHYSGSPVCAPSRCALMTGYHTGHTFIRENRQYNPKDPDSGQWPIPADTVTLPKLLHTLGYVSGGYGKWGLGGMDTTGNPLKQGFDHFYGYNSQGIAHNYYPTYLWDDDRRVTLRNKAFSAHQKLPAGADPNDPKSYEPFIGTDYAPDLIGQKALEFVRANKDKPFFLYYPTTVPHLALQVPADSLKEYEGKFPEEPYTGDRDYLPNRTPRATYAAMVTRMDRDFGRVLSLLKELDLESDTIVIFTSDNGPLDKKFGGTDTDFFNSAGGLRGAKGGVYEAGMREPCIVRWPGRVKPASVSDRVTGFEDWLPTLLDLIGKPQLIPAGIDGISFAPTLLGKPQDSRPFLYRETPGYGGQQCVRVGNWKAVRQNLNPRPKQPLNPGPVELYDLGADPHESKDVAAEHPDIVAKLSKLLTEQHRASEVFPIRALDAHS